MQILLNALQHTVCTVKGALMHHVAFILRFIIFMLVPSTERWRWPTQKSGLVYVGPPWASCLEAATGPAAPALGSLPSITSHFFGKARNTDIPQRMVIISGISLLSEWLTEFLALNAKLKSNEKSLEGGKKFISLQRRTAGCKEN